MEDDLENEDLNPELAALSVNYPELAGKDPREMQRAFLPMYLGAVESERAAREKSATALADRYKAAEEAIKQQRFGAPTTSQQLAALSQALLAPRRMRGFAGTLANVMPAITGPADLQAAAETKREAALRQLREQYATAADASAVGTAAAKREALGKVLPLMKPGSRRTALSASSDRVIDLDTGEEVVPLSSVPQAAIDQLKSYVQNPGTSDANRTIAMQNFERRFRVPAAQFLSGGR